MAINRQYHDFHSISNVKDGLVFYLVSYEVNFRGPRKLYISIRGSFRRSRPVFSDIPHAFLRITGFHGGNFRCAFLSIVDIGLFFPPMHLSAMKTTCVGPAPTPADAKLFYNEAMRKTKST